MIRKLIAWARLAVAGYRRGDVNALKRTAKILKIARAHNAITLIDQSGEVLELHQ